MSTLQKLLIGYSVFHSYLITNLLGSDIKLLLNSPILYCKPNNKTLSIAGKALLDKINKSKSSIDFAIYGLRNQNEIINALILAKKEE